MHPLRAEGFSYVSVERRAENTNWRAEILGNFGRISAYFRRIRYILNSIFGKVPHSRGHNKQKLFEKPMDPIGVEDCICYLIVFFSNVSYYIRADVTKLKSKYHTQNILLFNKM
jgi:hypothetical protein